MRTLLLCLLCPLLARADAELIGQIFDSEKRDGGVLEFAVLRLANPEDLDGEPIAVRTDRMGRFSLKLPAGAYRIGDIRKPSEKDPSLFESYFGRDLIEVGHAPMYDIGVIVLERAGSYLQGTVTKGGRPKAGVTVEVFLPGAGVPSGATAMTDSNGRYQLQFPDVRWRRRVAVRVAEGESGQVFAGAEVDLWVPGRADLTLPDSYAELMIDLTAPGETRVHLHPAGDPAPYISHRMKGTSKAAVSGLAPGRWAVTAVCNGGMAHAEVDLPAAAPVAMAIPAAARHRVSGTVAIPGLPADFDRRSLAVVARPSEGGPAGYLWAPVGRDGSFSFPGLAAGRYEVLVAAGTVFEPLQYFSVRGSALAMPTLDLGSPRELTLSARADDLIK
ncbi:MAG: carboxypeptidase regulatory-like domain-containing protein [Candidatus Brocadiae bacterium]|nr:carboxypeptidase regulatory-like domain-containing protein [Candidatus Brocadiia bacterium]